MKYCVVYVLFVFSVEIDEFLLSIVNICKINVKIVKFLIYVVLFVMEVDCRYLFKLLYKLFFLLKYSKILYEDEEIRSNEWVWYLFVKFIESFFNKYCFVFLGKLLIIKFGLIKSYFVVYFVFC